MRILMLGNSFTTANHMPDMLAELTGAEIVQHTRGGERLADQLNPKTKMGKRTQEALQNEKWDFVILQEMSNGLITSKASFLENAEKLCEKIRENGAKPVFYATWAYQRGEKKLETFGMDYDEMYQKLYEAYHLCEKEKNLQSVRRHEASCWYCAGYVERPGDTCHGRTDSRT